MRPNRLVRLWSEGGVAANAWLALADGLAAEIVALRGFDSVVFDLQHGMAASGDLPRLLQAVGSTDAVPLVRVPANEPAIIMRALDAGAMGVIVPMVETAEQAAAAVAACRYPPAGIRSYGPTRAAQLHGPEYHLHADAEVIVFCMVETREGLENLDAIAAVEGLTGLYVGPADLSYAVGTSPRFDSDHPAQVAAVARILAACGEHGIVAGIHTADPEFARRKAQEGFCFVTVAADTASLAAETGRRLAAFRA